MLNNITWNGSSFWHGTSTIFMDSIRATGLSAINPSTDFKLLDVLKFLYHEIKRLEISHPVLEINHSSIEAAIAQSDLDCNGLALNYRHEGIYISASQIRAAYYACLNKVGSEILEKCLILLSELINVDKEPEIPAQLDILGVRKYLDKPAMPIMIEITNVDDENLVLENGNNATQILKELRYEFPALPIAQQFERLQFCNFRVLNTIPASSLRFYEVDFEGHQKNRDFQFYLSHIR